VIDMNIHICGDVNISGEVTVSDDISLRELLESYGEGPIGQKRIKFVQVGGPLGKVVRGSEMECSIECFKDNMPSESVMYIADDACAVDFVRFLIQYGMRELQIKDSSRVKGLFTLCERMVSGDSESNDLSKFESLLSQKDDSGIESHICRVITSILQMFRGEFEQHIKDKKCVNGICHKLFDARCINACPAEVRVPEYVALMAQGMYEKAYELMRQENPLPFICGKVCARPCESKCRRGEIEKTVGVRALKRFASEYTHKAVAFTEDKLLSNQKKVAIVGAGPAGLSAAYYLLRTGYEVIIYEASQVIGGMLAMGIPAYRLPQETIDLEVDLIQKLGAKIQTDMKVGRDIQFEEIKQKNDAILLATGCHIPNRFGPEIDGLETAIEFLRSVKVNGRKTAGKEVLVIGGGDVAIDVARTAIRLGAKSVKVASLESFALMPASEEEKKEAVEDGVIFLSGYGTHKVISEEERVTAVIIKRCLSVFDTSYRFNPQYNSDDVAKVDADLLILAIGQKPDYSYLDGQISMNGFGWIDVNKSSMQTSDKNVFAAGDMIKPGIAVKAIAEGKRAAVAIDKYLGGKGLYKGSVIDIPQLQLECTTWDISHARERLMSSQERIGGFEEVSLTYSEEEARREALRCMRCDRNSKQ